MGSYVDNNILGDEDVGVIIMNPTDNVIRIGRILYTTSPFHSPNLNDIHWRKYCWSIIMCPTKVRVIGTCLENANTTLRGCVHLGHLGKTWGAIEEHAQMLSTVDCCSEHCCHVFPRPLLISIREHYFSLSFNAQKLIALLVF